MLERKIIIDTVSVCVCVRVPFGCVGERDCRIAMQSGIEAIELLIGIADEEKKNCEN